MRQGQGRAFPPTKIALDPRLNPDILWHHVAVEWSIGQLGKTVKSGAVATS